MSGPIAAARVLKVRVCVQCGKTWAHGGTVSVYRVRVGGKVKSVPAHQKCLGIWQQKQPKRGDNEP